jgi:hypothetical protein
VLRLPTQGLYDPDGEWSPELGAMLLGAFCDAAENLAAEPAFRALAAPCAVKDAAQGW